MLGQQLYANRLEILTVPTARLGNILTVLSEPDQDSVIRAIDEMISRA